MHHIAYIVSDQHSRWSNHSQLEVHYSRLAIRSPNHDHRREGKGTATLEQPACWASCSNILAASSNAFTLCDLVTLTFWPNINWLVRYRDGLSLSQVWRFYFSRFSFIMWTDRQTDRITDRQTDRQTESQTESQRQINAILTWLLSAWVIIALQTDYVVSNSIHDHIGHNHNSSQQKW